MKRTVTHLNTAQHYIFLFEKLSIIIGISICLLFLVKNTSAQNGISTCELPLDRGHCNDWIARYYFDAETGKCELFNYRGCGGNANNYGTYTACLTACKSVMSCSDGQIRGCTDSTATNYNPSANCDNGYCEYENSLVPGNYNIALCRNGNVTGLQKTCPQGIFEISENTSNTTATIEANGLLTINERREVEGYLKIRLKNCNSEWVFNLSNAENRHACFSFGYDNLIVSKPWLSHIVTPSNCSNTGVATYSKEESDISFTEHYVYVMKEEGNILYRYDGKIICVENDFSPSTCIELYDLKYQDNSWICADNTQIEVGCTYSIACNYSPAAAVHNGDCDLGCIRPLFNIDCPNSINRNTYVCAPVSILPLKLEDFIETNDEDILNQLSMEVEEIIEVEEYFTTTIYNYIFTEDTSGLITSCQTVNYIANQFLQAPNIAQNNVVCEGELWSSIKVGLEDYKIYADENGIAGKELSTCKTSGLICSTADLGVDTNQPGTYNFLISSYFEFPDGTICESEASPFYVDVQAKPTAVLSMQNKTMRIGEGLSLMDVVANNKSGYWSGENILYLMTATGENIAYFSANEAGVYKLYYTVRNEHCERSYLLVIEVSSAGKAAATQASYKKMDTAFEIYPNPTSKQVFIDLPSEAIYQINITDISGKVMKQMETDLKTANMDVSDLHKGIYLVEVKSEENRNIQKLMIK